MKEKNRCSNVILSYLCSGVPDLDLETLIGVCFHDVLQPAFYQFVPGMILLLESWYSKCKVFIVNPCYLQLLATCKKVLSLTKSIMEKKCFFVLVVFPWPIILFDFRWYK